MRNWTFGFISVLFLVQSAGADCTSPAAPNGAIRYDSASKTIKFCGNDNWNEIVTAGAGDFPVGSILTVASASCPTGYLLADGSSISRATYADLFAVIGVTYGHLSGTTFNLPDLRGRFLRGLDGGVGRDQDAGSRLDRGDGTTGDAVGTHQSDEIAAHSHSSGTLAGSTSTNGNHSHTVGINRPTNAATSGGAWRAIGTGSDIHPPSNTTGNHSHTVTINSGATSSSGGNETRPINIAVLKCIKASQ